MTATITESQKSLSTPTLGKYTDKRQKELRDAVERVYRKYGTDLTAFRKDIQRELAKREG